MEDNDMTHGLTRGAELAYAFFALGRFIDYRIDEGMQPDDLVVFMQAWLNMRARFDGRPAESLADLKAKKLDATPLELSCLARVNPYWLPDAEKLRRLRHCFAGEPQLPTIEEAAHMSWGC